MNNFIKESSEVLYACDEILKINHYDIQRLRDMAKLNSRKIIRLCMHRSKHDKVHEMIIYHPKNTYVPPHMHKNKSESFQILLGKADCVIFNENGVISEVIELSELSSGNNFYYKILPQTYHTQIFLEDTIFIEVSEGPFNKDHTIIADWLPSISDKNNTTKYKNELVNTVKKYKAEIDE